MPIERIDEELGHRTPAAFQSVGTAGEAPVKSASPTARVPRPALGGWTYGPAHMYQGAPSTMPTFNRSGTSAPLACPGVFRLNADPAFVAIAHVAGDRAGKAGGAVDGSKANPILLPGVDNLATPIAFVAD